jgi:Flp pilus assembly protein TadD
LFGQLGRFEEALKFFTQAGAVQPNNFAVQFNRGKALKELKRYDEALSAYEQALSLKPDFAEAYNNRGNVLKDLKRYDEALVSYGKATVLKPDYANAYNNQGATLVILQRHDEALASYDKALSLHPAYAEAYNNRGTALEHLRRYDEALASYSKAIELKPDFAEARYHKGMLSLLLGNFADGWRLHEWRWQTAQLQDFAKNFKQPLWLGDPPIAGKTILLHSEQGLGDTIQFARYVPMVEALGATVILGVPVDLLALFHTLEGHFTLIAEGDALPGFDLHCPLMSLPLAFGTTLDSIPARIPYLAADPQKQRAWQGRLGPKVRPRLGLVWSGNPHHINDRYRSMSLRTLAPLLKEDFEFHSLQKALRAEDWAALADFPQLHSHSEALHDFTDTAALVAELDGVITIDTSVAHLAGALGKPVWILLPYVADYRWLTQRNDSPWYPTARLFRQNSIGDWSNVIEDVIHGLHESHAIAG